MGRIGASYAYWYILKYQRCGQLFQDRYKSEPVEDENNQGDGSCGCMS